MDSSVNEYCEYYSGCLVCLFFSFSADLLLDILFYFILEYS